MSSKFFVSLDMMPNVGICGNVGFKSPEVKRKDQSFEQVTFKGKFRDKEIDHVDESNEKQELDNWGDRKKEGCESRRDECVAYGGEEDSVHAPTAVC